MEEELEEEKKEFNIYPAKKLRKLLTFVGDFFVLFIFCIFIYEIIALPIYKTIVNFPEYSITYNTLSEERNQILKENNLLTYEEDDSFETGLKKTAISYTNYYVTGENQSSDVVYNYFVSYKKDDVSVVNSLMEKYLTDFINKNEYTSIGTYKLNQKYIDLFLPYYTPGDELSSDGETAFNEFIETDFLRIYQAIISDIKENDMKSESYSLSYNECSNSMSKINNSIKYVYINCAILVYVICSSVYFVLIPLINHKGQTFVMFLLHVERIDLAKIVYLKKIKRLIIGLINIFSCGAMLVFLPVISLGINGIFALNSLWLFSAICLVFILINMVVMLIDKYARSLIELSSNSLFVDSDLMDEYYRETQNEL